jgi:hypothetical protein
MQDKCAFCGEKAVHVEPMPFEWGDYLRIQRDITNRFVGSIGICEDCYPEWHDLRHATGYGAADLEESKQLLNRIEQQYLQGGCDE